MAESRILQIADALVEVVRDLMPVGDADAEVTRTYYGRRFDAATTRGRKVYVVPREDSLGDRDEAGDRARDPMDYVFSIVVAEKMPGGERQWSEKDTWVDERVDFVTTLRERLKNIRDYSLITGLDLHPVDTGPRETCDLAALNQTNVFISEFTNTIREV